MKIPLSNRLLACCDFVHPGERVADIGCDHGYLGIYLLHHKIASGIIAADVNENPLKSAVINAARFGVSNQISFYLSNGVRNIPRDFTCMVCAGMGADTMISILESAPWLKSSQYHLILQCQSKRPELRRFLLSQGYAIQKETLAQDGKFIYTIMDVTYAPGQVFQPHEYYITPALLASGSPLLDAFRARVIGGLEETAKGMAYSNDPRHCEYTQLLAALKGNEK